MYHIFVDFFSIKQYNFLDNKESIYIVQEKKSIWYEGKKYNLWEQIQYINKVGSQFIQTLPNYLQKIEGYRQQLLRYELQNQSRFEKFKNDPFLNGTYHDSHYKEQNYHYFKEAMSEIEGLKKNIESFRKQFQFCSGLLSIEIDKSKLKNKKTELSAQYKLDILSNIPIDINSPTYQNSMAEFQQDFFARYNVQYNGQDLCEKDKILFKTIYLKYLIDKDDISYTNYLFQLTLNQVNLFKQWIKSEERQEILEELYKTSKEEDEKIKKSIQVLTNLSPDILDLLYKFCQLQPKQSLNYTLSESDVNIEKFVELFDNDYDLERDFADKVYKVKNNHQTQILESQNLECLIKIQESFDKKIKEINQSFKSFEETTKKAFNFYFSNDILLYSYSFCFIFSGLCMIYFFKNIHNQKKINKSE